MAEWLNAALSKSVVRLIGVPGVRISPPPLGRLAPPALAHSHSRSYPVARRDECRSPDGSADRRARRSSCRVVGPSRALSDNQPSSAGRWMRLRTGRRPLGSTTLACSPTGRRHLAQAKRLAIRTAHTGAVTWLGKRRRSRATSGRVRPYLCFFSDRLGQGTVTVCVTVSPVWNVASNMPVKPPRGQVVGTVP